MLIGDMQRIARTLVIIVAMVAAAALSGAPGIAGSRRGTERTITAAGSNWTQPFDPDEHTIVLYHFNEGEGNQAGAACGDPELTLHAHKKALWGSRPGFGRTARFERRKDDANVLVGPVNNDKLELRTCTEAWTIEAWVRHTGELESGNQAHGLGNNYRNICGTDDEGLGMPEGVRGGWNFKLHASAVERGIAPMARFIGSLERCPNNDVNAIGARLSKAGDTGARPAAIDDAGWHHVAWQFRYADQMHFLFLDGKLIWKMSKPGGRAVINDAPRCDLPFVVGGFLHSQDPAFHLNYGNFAGEIDELRISDCLRYPVADRLAIVERELPPAGLYNAYEVPFSTDAATGEDTWKLTDGNLPEGLHFDESSGVLHGRPKEIVDSSRLTIQATDASANSDDYTFTLSVRGGYIIDESLPLAFTGHDYRHQLSAKRMTKPISWKVRHGTLPQGISFDQNSGELKGEASNRADVSLRIQATGVHGQTDEEKLRFKVVPGVLRQISPDKNTVCMWDWQGPSGKLIPDVMGDEKLTLTWVNMKGDTRLPRPGWGRYPHFIGGGEGGFVGPQHNNKVNLRTCNNEWTVEAWVKRGGPVDGYGSPFHFGHICGTYDSSERGVWELYLSDKESPDGSMAPGVHFQSSEHTWEYLHPWSRPDGIVAEQAVVGIRDEEWHHVAWQYSYEEDLHQLFLDGRLIWKMQNPDGRRLVNDRRHDAQFSVGSRLKGYARYGGAFNFRGWGHFFGQIGDIRISNTRRY